MRLNSRSLHKIILLFLGILIGHGNAAVVSTPQPRADVGYLAPDSYQLQVLNAMHADYQQKIAKVETDCHAERSKFEMNARRKSLECSYNRWMDAT